MLAQLCMPCYGMVLEETPPHPGSVLTVASITIQQRTLKCRNTGDNILQQVPGIRSTYTCRCWLLLRTHLFVKIRTTYDIKMFSTSTDSILWNMYVGVSSFKRKRERSHVPCIYCTNRLASYHIYRVCGGFKRECERAHVIVD